MHNVANCNRLESMMADNLRDRIAAALKAEDEKPHICPFDGEPTMASYDRLADAVIRELADYIIAEPEIRPPPRRLWDIFAAADKTRE